MPRPNPKSLDAPWKPIDQCPCESGLVYRECCLWTDGAPLIQIPSLSPSGSSTGYEHKKCYLNFTKNCCLKISGEHFISKSILSQFKGLSFSGMPWQSAGEKNVYHPNNLKAKILCQRHNNALSPLDAAASHFFKKVFEATHHVTKRSVSKRSKFFLVSGEALELWALKTILGMFHAKVSRTNGTTMHGNYMFDNKVAEEALFGRGIIEPRGIYLEPTTGNLLQEGIQFAPLSSDTNQTLNGLKIIVSGFTLDFIFDPRGANPHFFSDNHRWYRPWVFDLTGKNRSSRVILTWKSQRKKVNRIELKITPGGTRGSNERS